MATIVNTTPDLSDVCAHAGEPIPPEWKNSIDRLIADLRAASLNDLPLASRAWPGVVRAADELALAPQRVRARTVASGVLCLGNEFDRALALLVEARTIGASGADPRAQAEVEVAAVQPCARLGRLEDAAAHAQRGVELFERAGDRVSEGRARCNLGVVHRMCNRKSDAVRELERAAALIDDPVMRAQIRSNTAEVLLELEDHDGAARAFTEAIASFQAAGASRAAAIALGNLADVHGRRGQLQAALGCFDNAIALVSDGASPGDAARLLAEKAEVVAASGVLREASAMLREAGLRLEAAGLLVESLRARVGHARVMSTLGHSSLAERELSECAERASAIGSNRTGALARLARAAVLVGLARVDDASSEIARARAELGAVAAVSLEEARSALARCDFAACAEAAGAMLREGAGASPAVAIEARLLRGEALAASGDLRGAIADLDAALNAIEHERLTFTREEHRVGWLGHYVDAFHRLIELRCAEGERADASAIFALAERARGRALLERLHGEADVRARIAEAGGVAPARIFEHTVSAERVRATLDADAALVECIPIGSALGAVVLRRKGTTLVRFSVSVEQCVELVERLNFEASCDLARLARAGNAVPDRALRSSLRALHDGVWRHLLPALDGVRAVTIVPHGPLHGAPLHLAFDGTRHVVESFSVGYSPSAGLFTSRHWQSTGAPANQGLLAVGVGDEAAPYAGQEAVRVSRAHPGATLLEGERATVSAVRDALEMFGVAHLAGHAVHIRHDPLRSGVKLADGWLTAAHAMTLRMPGTRIVLSCCNAGESSVEPGDEIYGLVRALLCAGASSVIAPLWEVHDGFAPQFMDQLHAALMDRERAAQTRGAEALAVVQRDFARAGAHPALWGGFFAME